MYHHQRSLTLHCLSYSLSLTNLLSIKPITIGLFIARRFQRTGVLPPGQMSWYKVSCFHSLWSDVMCVHYSFSQLTPTTRDDTMFFLTRYLIHDNVFFFFIFRTSDQIDWWNIYTLSINTYILYYTHPTFADDTNIWTKAQIGVKNLSTAVAYSILQRSSQYNSAYKTSIDGVMRHKQHSQEYFDNKSVPCDC